MWKKWTGFSKASVSVRVSTVLSFLGVKMSTFTGQDAVQGWESDEKSVFGQSLGPSGLSSKAWNSVRVRVGLSRCENAHCFLWTTRVLDNIGAPAKVLKSGLFSRARLALVLV